MPKIRAIKPEAFRSRTLSRVSYGARWTFAGLWCWGDDEGVLRDDALLIKGDVWALDEDVTSAQVEEWLKELAGVGVICRYVAGEGTAQRSYLHVVNFDEHQKMSRTVPSRLPKCSLDHGPPTLFSVETVLRHGAEHVGKGKGKGTKTLPQTLARFGEFYGPYPRHVGKLDAEKAWAQALAKGADPDVIITGARRLAADPNLPPKDLIPYPASWLRRGGWEDDPHPPRSTGSGNGTGQAEAWQPY